MSSLQSHMPTDQTYETYSTARLVSNVFGLFLHYIIYSLNIHLDKIDGRKKKKKKKETHFKVTLAPHSQWGLSSSVARATKGFVHSLLDESSADREDQSKPLIQSYVLSLISSLTHTVGHCMSVECPQSSSWYGFINKMTQQCQYTQMQWCGGWEACEILEWLINYKRFSWCRRRKTMYFFFFPHYTSIYRKVDKAETEVLAIRWEGRAAV